MTSPSAKKSPRFTKDMLERHEVIIRRVKNGSLKRLEDLVDEFGVSLRTIKTDIETLRNLGHDMSRSREAGCWQYLSPPPDLALSEEEIFALMVAERVVAQFEGTPFEMPLRKTLQQFTGGKTKFGISWEDLQRGISFHNTGLSKVDLEIYQTVIAGVSQRREIQLYYKGLEDESYKKRNIRPYHICYVNGQWYLLAYDFKKEAIRKFVLPRIKRPTLLDTRFQAPKLSEIQDLGKGMGIWGGEEVEVALKFFPPASKWMPERNWHLSQEFSNGPKKSVIMKIKVIDSPDLEQWILGWGELVEVLEPSGLRNRITKRLKKAYSIYTK